MKEKTDAGRTAFRSAPPWINHDRDGQRCSAIVRGQDMLGWTHDYDAAEAFAAAVGSGAVGS